MCSNFLLWAFLICFHSFLIVVRCQDIGTNVKTNFCPKYNYVSRIEFNKTLNNNYEILVECQNFQPTTSALLGQEECALRLPFPLQDYTLMWNDYLRNCRCNEYIAGIKQFEAGWDGKAVTSGGTKTKLMQLQCCWSSNKEQNPPSCVYSGMENLQSPWGSSSLGVRQSEMQQGRNYAIQSLVIREGNINARVCDYRVANTIGYSWPSSGIHGCWSGVDFDCTENADTGGICYDKTTSLFSWNEPMVYDSNLGVASLKLFYRQQQICKTGHRMTGLTKSVVNDLQGKAYQFSIKCSPMASRSCYCVWLPKCPIDEFFGSSNNWHVTGIRSEWDPVDKDSKIEVLCCHSHSVKPGVCKSEELRSDTDTNFDLNDKLYMFPLKSQTPLRVITNIETYYDNGVLNMRFNVCSALYTFDWCYNDPCYWCRSKAYRDGVSVGGSGYWSQQDSGVSSSSLSTQSLQSDQMADSNYWNSWSGWSSTAGNWGDGCGGLPLSLMWRPSVSNPFQGSWSSWNSWHRNYNAQDDYHYSNCPSCYRATTVSRWSKFSRSSNGRSAWAAAGGSNGFGKSATWSNNNHNGNNAGSRSGSGWPNSNEHKEGSRNWSSWSNSNGNNGGNKGGSRWSNSNEHKEGSRNWSSWSNSNGNNGGNKGGSRWSNSNEHKEGSRNWSSWSNSNGNNGGNKGGSGWPNSGHGNGDHQDNHENHDNHDDHNNGNLNNHDHGDHDNHGNGGSKEAGRGNKGGLASKSDKNGSNKSGGVGGWNNKSDKSSGNKASKSEEKMKNSNGWNSKSDNDGANKNNGRNNKSDKSSGNKASKSEEKMKNSNGWNKKPDNDGANKKSSGGNSNKSGGVKVEGAHGRSKETNKGGRGSNDNGATKNSGGRGKSSTGGKSGGHEHEHGGGSQGSVHAAPASHPAPAPAPAGGHGKGK